ncbi:MAG TPA: hypothetical protein VIR01_03205 [Pyrinomonadaceae bacterium]|jgi:hypothetical protein
MFEEKEPNPDELIDPPDHQGGGGEAESDLDSAETERMVDPPDHQGGGG